MMFLECISITGWLTVEPKRFEAKFASMTPNFRIDSTPKAFSSVNILHRASHHSQGFLLQAAIDKSVSNGLKSVLSGQIGCFPKTFPSLLQHRHSMPQRSLVTTKASSDVPSVLRYPPMTKKPRWWWRTLACIPYFMPLHETWMYAETAYHLHHFLENFEFLTYPFLRFLGTLPSWFLLAYFFAAYLGIVRRKEWPHFFRFHVVMGMLLEITLQVLGLISRWMPRAVYWGKIGMHMWAAIAFAYLFTVLECIRCALFGMYADVPFACDAAYIQIPYD